jgi:hypothetical protein
MNSFLFLVSRKTVCLSDMETVLLLHFPSDVHVPRLLYTSYLPQYSDRNKHE